MMIGKKIPRFFRMGLTLGIAVGVIMLSMFYGQYRWLANEIVTTGAKQHDAFLYASFERRMRAQLHMMADEIALEISAPDSSSVYDTLNRLTTNNATLAGLRFSGTNVAPVQSGDIATVPSGETVAWLADILIMSYPVSRDDTQLGELLGAFRLDRLHAESASFANDLVDTELQNRRTSYFWHASVRSNCRPRSSGTPTSVSRCCKLTVTSLANWLPSLMTCVIDCVQQQYPVTTSTAFCPA
jgi:hypothetical protein